MFTRPRIWICSKFNGFFHDPPTNFHENHVSRFYIILLTKKQTENITSLAESSIYLSNATAFYCSNITLQLLQLIHMSDNCSLIKTMFYCSKYYLVRDCTQWNKGGLQSIKCESLHLFVVYVVPNALGGAKWFKKRTTPFQREFYIYLKPPADLLFFFTISV